MNEADSLPPGPRPPLTPAAACEMAVATAARAAILVEGWSDQAAVDALARKRHWDLAAQGVLTVPIGGVTNMGAFIQALGASGLGLRLAGLYDAGEEGHVRRTLERAGLGVHPSPTELEAHGFFACDADLEDELIRALGAATVQAVLQAQGELQSFRRFQDQPAQRRRDVHAQLRRFMGTRARRKVRYGALLAQALESAQVPRALDLVLAYALDSIRRAA